MPELTPQARYIIAARVEGYIGNDASSVDILTEALDQYPGDIRLLRTRGHRRITIRDYAGAIADLTEAAAMIDDTPDEYELYQNCVEPDGMRLIIGQEAALDHHPLVSDIQGTPAADAYKTTLHTAIWYHLGVAQYVTGDLEAAAETYAKAFASALHYEGKVASLDWQYMALRRLGRDEEAAALLDVFAGLADEFDKQGEGYDDRMRLYSGEITPEQLATRISDRPILVATVGYGLGNWYLYNGDETKAREVFQNVIDSGVTRAFAYLAAEAELARA